MKNIYTLLLFLILLFVLIIPKIFEFYKLKISLKTKMKLYQLNIKIKNDLIAEYNNLIVYNKNLSFINEIQINKIEYIYSNISHLEMYSLDEENDLFLLERYLDENKCIIKFYEKNKLKSNKTLNNLSNYFKNNSYYNYFNSIYNVLLVSDILLNKNDVSFIYNYIFVNVYNNQINSTSIILGDPCFKLTFDGINQNIFHRYCDDMGDTLVLIKTNKTRFGGITDFSWSGKTQKKNTISAIFNIDNKKIFKYKHNLNSINTLIPIGAANFYFLNFGGMDIYLGNIPNESYSRFPYQYGNENNTSYEFNYILNEKYSAHRKDHIIYFEYEEIEIYPIINKK